MGVETRNIKTKIIYKLIKCINFILKKKLFLETFMIKKITFYIYIYFVLQLLSSKLIIFLKKYC